jgi:hypothetical protein
MAVQVWFHTGFAQGGAGDTPLPKEPPVGYATETVTTSNVAISVPGPANIAVIETDAPVAYKVNSAAVYANDPIIPITSNSRYVVDVQRGSTINFIGTS